MLCPKAMALIFSVPNITFTCFRGKILSVCELPLFNYYITEFVYGHFQPWLVSLVLCWWWITSSKAGKVSDAGQTGRHCCCHTSRKGVWSVVTFTLQEQPVCIIICCIFLLRFMLLLGFTLLAYLWLFINILNMIISAVFVELDWLASVFSVESWMGVKISNSLAPVWDLSYSNLGQTHEGSRTYAN